MEKIINKETLKNKIQKLSKTGADIAHVVSVIVVTLSVLGLILVIFDFVDGKSINDSITAEDSFISVEGFDVKTYGNHLAAFIGWIFEGIILSSLAIISTAMLKRISQTGLPFTSANVSSLKKLAVLIMVDSFVPTLMCSIADIIISRFSETATSTGIIFNVDIDTVLIGALFFLLATIFSYGAKLQQESDETL